MSSRVDDRARPTRMTTVISQQPWWRSGTVEQRRAVAECITQARHRTQHRYARVKAHPDLAERLCRTLGLNRLDQWNGYVPDRHDDQGRVNTSPIRAEIIAVLHAVSEREQGTP